MDDFEKAKALRLAGFARQFAGGGQQGRQAAGGLVPPPLPVVPPPLPSEVVAPKVKRSKKLDLAKLPKQWRNTVFDNTSGRLRDAVAVLWSTGCRPEELSKGVKVSLVSGRLVVEIAGAKHGQIDNGETVADRGLEWRKIVLNPALNNATRHLAGVVEKSNGPMVVSYNKNSLRTRLNEVGRLHLKKVPDGVTVSPYTFRHAMGSDLKSCDDMSDEEKAMVMGHLSVTSLSVYGRRRHRGGVSPVQAVEASDMPHGEYTDAPREKTSKRAKPR